jgi:hypothetical protein
MQRSRLGTVVATMFDGKESPPTDLLFGVISGVGVLFLFTLHVENLCEAVYLSMTIGDLIPILLFDLHFEKVVLGPPH